MDRGYFCPKCMSPVDPDRGTCPQCGYTRPVAGWPPDEHLGRVINGKYRVEEKLGKGGFGVVLRARHVREGQDFGVVVLKFLHTQLADDPSFRQRFMNEARAARKLTSPHIVKIFDFDFDERGHPFIVMEYLRGDLLYALIKQGPMEPARVFRVARQITGALQECHNAEVLHRDLTPRNITLLAGHRRDFVKVFDFGIARLPDTTLSMTMLGTPRYMPPEQILQEDLDGRVDVFALGVILYQCLSGESPIVARKSVEYFQLNLDVPPRPLRRLRPELPAELERLLEAMMAKDRRQRPSSMVEVEEQLVAIGVENGWLVGEQREVETAPFIPLTPGPEATGQTRRERPASIRGPEPKSDPGPEHEHEPETISQPEPEPEPETASQPGPEAEPEAEPETISQPETQSEQPGTLAPVVRTTKPPPRAGRSAIVWGSALGFVAIVGAAVFFVILSLPGTPGGPAFSPDAGLAAITDSAAPVDSGRRDLTLDTVGEIGLDAGGPAPDVTPDAATRRTNRTRLRRARRGRGRRRHRPRPAATKRPAKPKAPPGRSDPFKKVEGGL